MKLYALLPRLSPIDRRDTPILQLLRFFLRHQILPAPACQSTGRPGVQPMRLQGFKHSPAQNYVVASPAGVSVECRSRHFDVASAPNLAGLLRSPASARPKRPVALDADCSLLRTSSSGFYETAQQRQEKEIGNTRVCFGGDKEKP